jgi:ketosteroid isomerase-like protein
MSAKGRYPVDVDTDARETYMRMRSIQITAAWLVLALASSIALAAPPLRHQAPTGDELTATITALDSAVFNAYNHCDLKTFARYFAPDVEFYHDKGGLTRSRAKLVDSIKNNVCGKLTRELVAGTLEVYPIKGFGALEMGTHRFRSVNSGRYDGVARFIQLWEYHDGHWRITRVVSYDHAPIH